MYRVSEATSGSTRAATASFSADVGRVAETELETRAEDQRELVGLCPHGGDPRGEVHRAQRRHGSE